MVLASHQCFESCQLGVQQSAAGAALVLTGFMQSLQRFEAVSIDRRFAVGHKSLPPKSFLIEPPALV